MIIGLSLLVFNSPAFPFNDTPESRKSLRDLTQIYVVIEGVTPELEQNGLNADKLKKDVAIQLKKSGIEVITTVEGRELPESYPAGLYVRINALKSAMLKSNLDIDYYAISISVELIQRCLPLTEKNIDSSYISSHSALGCTWSTSNIYLAGEERIGNIGDCVRELVGHFIKAYLSVNARRSKAYEFGRAS
jgi:hypothetical protein